MTFCATLVSSLTLTTRGEALEMYCRGKSTATANVVDLCPSINVDAAMEALRWFTHEHTRIHPSLRSLHLHPAKFMLEKTKTLNPTYDFFQDKKILLTKALR